MNGTSRRHDEAGMVGKVVVAWLLVLALVGLAAIDTVSIVITRLHAADVAGNAASDAAASFRLTHNVQRACQAAATTVDDADPRITLAPDGCKIDPRTGDATIVVHKDATTMIAGRFGLTKKFASVTDTETAPPPTL
jgi:hypothetical protein